MMKLFWGFLCAGLVLACSSSDDAGSACANIVGNYRVKSARIDGNCDAKLDGDGTSSMTIAKQTDGSYGLTVTNVQGTCPAAFDAACHFTANCRVFDQNTNATLFTADYDYTFTGTSFKGSSVGGANPPLVPSACNVTYHDEGTHL